MIQLLTPLPALIADTASSIGDKACFIAGGGALGCSTNLLAPGGFVTNTIRAVIGIIGAISVIMVIVGGLRYTLSGGDAAGIKSAKDTILYSLIGLAVSILAFVIVGYIIGSLRG